MMITMLKTIDMCTTDQLVLIEYIRVDVADELGVLLGTLDTVTAEEVTRDDRGHAHY